MATIDLRGMQVALITPFTADGSEVDVPELTAHVNRMVDAGLHGLTPNGSTGEFTSLSYAERCLVTETVIEAAAGRVPVVVGTGALTTPEAVSLSVHAAESGAAAVMVVPPFYDPVRIHELHDHLKAIHDASGLPIMYYNIPACSGLTLSAAELAELGQIPGVEYIKDTGGDASVLTEVLVKYSDAITIFNGWDTLTFTGLASRAKGSVWGAANIFPELAVELWDTVAVRGDLDAGWALWKKLWPICEYLDANNYAASVKAGVRLTGHAVGPIRSPFRDLDADSLAHLAGLIRDAGVEVVEL